MHGLPRATVAPPPLIYGWRPERSQGTPLERARQPSIRRTGPRWPGRWAEAPPRRRLHATRRSHREVLRCGHGEQPPPRLTPAGARALELAPQPEQLPERRRLLVLRGQHLLQRRHLDGHTKRARRLWGGGSLEHSRQCHRRLRRRLGGIPGLGCPAEGQIAAARKREGAASRRWMASPAAARMTSLTMLHHVGTDAPQRLSLLLELDVGLGHGLAEVARAARLLQQRQQVRAVQYARGGVLPDRKRPGWQESPQPTHDGRRTQPGIRRLPCRLQETASAGLLRWQWACMTATRAEGRLFPLGKRRVLRLEPRLTKRGAHLRHGGLLLVELEQPRRVVLDVRHDGDGLARGRWLDAQRDRTRSTVGASPQLAPVAAAQGDVLGQRKEQGVEHVGLAHAIGANLCAPIIRSAAGAGRVEVGEGLTPAR